MAFDTTPTDLDTRIAAFLNTKYPPFGLTDLPEVGTGAPAIAAIAPFSSLKDKAAYLAWVAEYKALITDLEAHIRSVKQGRRSADDRTRDLAQMQARRYASAATAMIHLRRLGKTWSAEEAIKSRTAQTA